MPNSKLPDKREPVIEVVDPAMAEVLRKKTEGERLAISWGMWRSARTMLTHFLRSEHPEWADDQLRREVARRLAHGTG